MLLTLCIHMYQEKNRITVENCAGHVSVSKYYQGLKSFKISTFHAYFFRALPIRGLLHGNDNNIFLLRKNDPTNVSVFFCFGFPFC